MARSPYNIQVSVDLVTRGETLVANQISKLQEAANETAGRINAATSAPNDVGRRGLDQARARAAQVISREARVATSARSQFQSDIDSNVQDLILAQKTLFSSSDLRSRFRAREEEARARIQRVFGISEDAEDPLLETQQRLSSINRVLGNEAYIRQARGFDSRGVRRRTLVSEKTATENLARAVATGNTRVLGAMGFDVSSPDFADALSTVRSSQYGRSMAELDKGVQSASKALDGYEKASLKLATTMENVDRELQRKLASLRRENERQDRENRRNLQQSTRNYQQSQSMVASERNAYRDRQRLGALADDDNLATINRVLSMTDSEWKTLDPSDRRHLLDRTSGLLNDTRFFSRSRFGGAHGAELHRIADSVEQRMRGAGINVERDLIAGQLQQAIRRGSVIDNAVNASGANNLSPMDRVRALFGIAPSPHMPGHMNPYNRDYNTSFNRFNERLSNVSQMAGLSLYGLGSVGFLTAMGGVTSRLYSEAQNQQLMIGGTLNTYLDFGGATPGQSFQMARRRGNQVYEDLRQRAEVSVLNTAELADYFISGGPQLMRSGLSENDALQIVDQIAAIGKSMGYQSPAIQSDIRDLASGGITVRSQVLRAIGMSRTGLARAQSGGPDALKEYFNETLAGFGPALAEIQNTPMGRMNQVLDRLQRTGIEVGSGFFSGIDKPLAEVAASLQKLNENEGLLETAGARFGGFVGAVIEAAAKIMASPIGGVMANPLAAVTTGLGGFMALSQWRERTGFRTQNWMQMTPQERANRPLNYYSMFTEGSWADRVLAGPLPVPGSPDFEEQANRRNQRVGRASRFMAGAARAAGAAAAGFVGLEIADFFLARSQQADSRNSTAIRDTLAMDATASGAAPVAAREAAVREYLATGQITGDRSLYNQRIAAARDSLYRSTEETQAHQLLYQASPFGLLGLDIPALGLRSGRSGLPGRMGFDERLRGQFEQVVNRIRSGSNLESAIGSMDMSPEQRDAFRVMLEAVGGESRLSSLQPNEIGRFYESEIRGASRNAFNRTRMTEDQASSLMSRIRAAGGTGANNQVIRELVSQLVRNESGQLRQSLSNDLEAIQTVSGIQTGLSSALISRENRLIAGLGPANPNAIQNLNRIRGLQIYQADLNFASNAMDNPESARVQRQAEMDQANDAYLQSIRALRMEIVERQRNTDAMRRNTDTMRISARADLNDQRLSMAQGFLLRSGRTDEFFQRFFAVQSDRLSVLDRRKVDGQISANQEVEDISIMTATLDETNKFFAQVLQNGLPPLKIDEMSYAGIKTEMGGLGTIVSRVEQAIRVDFGEHVRSFSDVIDRFQKTVSEFEAKVNAKIQELTGAVPGGSPLDAIVRMGMGLSGTAQTTAPPSTPPSRPSTPLDWLLPPTPPVTAESSTIALSGQMIAGVPIEYLNASTDGGGSVYLFGSGEVKLPGQSQAQSQQSAASNPSTRARSNANSFVSPLRGVPLHVTSPFGSRRAPVQGASRNHRGVDLRAPMRSDVVATADGRVAFAGAQRGYGNVVYLEHENGVQTRYAHLDSFRVQVGDRVSRGQLIALSGNTGVSSGPHLHYEVRQKRGGEWLALNPKSQQAIELIAGLRSGSTSQSSSGSNDLLSVVAQNAPRLSGSQQSSIAQAVSEAATKYNLDEELLLAVIKAESNFSPTAVSSAGARGLMQLMPATARSLGVSNSFDIRQNIMGGAQYLRQQIDAFGDLELALAAYNAGPGNVRRHNGIPPFRETQAYVPRVLGFKSAFGLVSSGRSGQGVVDSAYERSRANEERDRAERAAAAMAYLSGGLSAAREMTGRMNALSSVESDYRLSMVNARTSRDRLQASGTRLIGRARNQSEVQLAELYSAFEMDMQGLATRRSEATNAQDMASLESQMQSRIERFAQDSARVQQGLDDLNLSVARALRTAERLDEQFAKSLSSATAMADSVTLLGVAAYRTRGLSEASRLVLDEQIGVRVSNLQQRRSSLTERLSEMGAPVLGSPFSLGGMLGSALDRARRQPIVSEIARLSSQISEAMISAEENQALIGLAGVRRMQQQAVNQINVQSSIELLNRSYSRGFDMFMSPVGRVDTVRQSMADRDARAETQALLYRQRIEADFVRNLQSQGMSAVEIQNRLSEVGPQLDMQAAQYRQRAAQFRNMLLPVDIRSMEMAANADRMAGIGSAAASALASDPLGVFSGRSGSFLSASLAGPLSNRMDSIGRRGSVLGRMISRQSITAEDLASIGYSQMADGTFRNSQGRIVRNLRGVLTSQLAAEIGGPMLGTWAGTAIGGSEEASSLGSQIGSLAGPSLFAGLGAWGGPVGAVAGGLLGGLLGRRRNPQDEENRRWQQDVVRLLASMDKSLRSENDLARMYRGSAYVGADTRYFSGRYNAPTSRDMTLGDVRR